MEQFIEFFNGLDQKILVIGVSIVLLWMFLKALRGFLHIFLLLSVAVVMVIQFPALKNFFISLIS